MMLLVFLVNLGMGGGGIVAVRRQEYISIGLRIGI